MSKEKVYIEDIKSGTIVKYYGGFWIMDEWGSLISLRTGKTIYEVTKVTPVKIQIKEIK